MADCAKECLKFEPRNPDRIVYCGFCCLKGCRCFNGPGWLKLVSSEFLTSHEHTCAVFDDGALQCIGANDYGQAPLDPVAEEDGKEDTLIKFPELGTGYIFIRVQSSVHSRGDTGAMTTVAAGAMECY